MKEITPIILHPLVAHFVGQLSRNTLRILIYIGCEVFKTNNRTITTKRRKDEKAAHVLVQREIVLTSCNITEEQWEQAVTELDKLSLLWVAERNSLQIDRYFLLSPNKHLVRKIIFKTRHTIPRTFRRNKWKKAQ